MEAERCDQLEEAHKKLEKFTRFSEALQEILPLPDLKQSTVGLQEVKTIVDVEPVETVVKFKDDTIPGQILSIAKMGKLDDWLDLKGVVSALAAERWIVSSKNANNALNDLEKRGYILKKHTNRNYYCLAKSVRFAE